MNETDRQTVSRIVTAQLKWAHTAMLSTGFTLIQKRKKQSRDNRTVFPNAAFDVTTRNTSRPVSTLLVQLPLRHWHNGQSDGPPQNGSVYIALLRACE